MPDPGHQPVLEAGEKLRRIVAGRRRRRGRLFIAALAALAAVPLAATAFCRTPVLFVWNASSSAPVGLYRLHSGEAVRRGDMVVARTPERARALAARRHYLPANVPLVKRVAAVAGDRVCAAAGKISINARRVAARRKSDPAGRPMPWWSGCHRLRAGEYFLLMESALSFDGRYFGITRGADVLGRAELLWGRPLTDSNHG